MKILYIGAGFVGACSAAVAADSGHEVLVYDIDAKKIAMLGSADRDTIELCLFEAGLGDMLVRNKKAIAFTNDYAQVTPFLDTAEAIFLCVATPEKAGAAGESDLGFYIAACEKLATHLSARNQGRQEQYVVLVNKSTVPINTVDLTEEIMRRQGVTNFGVVSNPEFLVEGKAIEGSVKPDRVVVGAWREPDFVVMRQVYQRFYTSPSVHYLEVNPKEAAAGKLLANFLLFNRVVTTYDVVGRTCEAFADVSFERVRHILTSDARIGSWGFFDSLYAGGSCFIKDAASLKHQLDSAGANSDQVQKIITANEFQRDNFFARAEREARCQWTGKTVAIMGVAFKRDTNDVRNSPALAITSYLIKAGVKRINLFDPAALPMFKVFREASGSAGQDKITYCRTEEEAIAGTSVCLILADWPQFRTLGEKLLTHCPPPYLIMDGRRMLSHQFAMLQQHGYDVLAVGSPFIKGVS